MGWNGSFMVRIVVAHSTQRLPHFYVTHGITTHVLQVTGIFEEVSWPVFGIYVCTEFLQARDD